MLLAEADQNKETISGKVYLTFYFQRFLSLSESDHKREIFEISLYLACRAGRAQHCTAAVGKRHQQCCYPPRLSQLSHTRDLNVFLTKSDVTQLNHTSHNRGFKMPSLEFPEPMTFYPTLEEWKDLPR